MTRPLNEGFRQSANEESVTLSAAYAVPKDPTYEYLSQNYMRASAEEHGRVASRCARRGGQNHYHVL